MQAPPPLPHLRHVADWRSMGIPLGNTSDEAARLLDALIYQSYGMYEATEFGGIEGTFNKLYAADPDLTFTNIFLLGQKVGRHLRNWPPLNPESAELCAKLENRLPVVNEWEKKHIQAALAKAQGFESRAAVLWEDCLATVPRDLFAGLSMFGNSLRNGEPEKMRYAFGQLTRNTAASDPFLGFYESRLAFGLTESGHHDEAKKWLDKSIEHISWEPWAHHTYAHVHDSLGQHREGWQRLRAHRKDWEMAEDKSILTCHNYWHEALFAWALGDNKEELVQLVDQEILPRVGKMRENAANLLTLGDAISILMRMELDDVLPQPEMQKRWDCISEVIERCGLAERGIGFILYDVHIALALLAGRRPDQHQKFIANLRSQCETLRDSVSSRGSSESEKSKVASTTSAEEDVPDIVICMNTVGVRLLKALEDFSIGDYEEAVETLYSYRRKIFMIGGSDAQRDLFLLVLYHCLGRSGTPLNMARLKTLLAERAFSCPQPNEPIERLRAKFHLDHDGEA